MDEENIKKLYASWDAKVEPDAEVLAWFMALSWADRKELRHNYSYENYDD